ncbi:hypothetical protein D5G26_05090, partial [Salmonella enterica subsp. enterica serovar Mbandaka]
MFRSNFTNFFVVVFGVTVGLIHQVFIYPYIFHADSAAYQVLASAIKDELSLLPHDFIYGNQLILLKISPFIAVAESAGFTAFKAYAIGGS